ncbi:VOC family protein [Bacillus sp. AFS015802]|uniref:VOC family protein n=1 Tax=Bacillus sp. AFS015802 TaxID=2033486 RepID=UPI0015CF2FD0|nr:VOC family protein [Bacillus sp. AFS015802]
MKVHHIGMKVKSLAVSKEFYQTYFGFQEEMKVTWDSEDILFLKKGNCRLELIEETGEKDGLGRTFLHLAFEVTSLEEEIGFLEEKGLLPVEGPVVLENGWNVAFFFGPDGEMIEMVEG